MVHLPLIIYHPIKILLIVTLRFPFVRLFEVWHGTILSPLFSQAAYQGNTSNITRVVREENWFETGLNKEKNYFKLISSSKTLPVSPKCAACLNFYLVFLYYKFLFPIYFQIGYPLKLPAILLVNKLIIPIHFPSIRMSKIPLFFVLMAVNWTLLKPAFNAR